MKTNIGSIERVVRIVIGLAILSLAFVGPASPWGYLGLVPLLTGLIGWCPPYALFGISTCGKTGSCCSGSTPSCCNR
ncbi:MAG: hypothetical protein BWK76_07050 [Desulfobulbaceae bacterium A2]|nr:MAG: hypothetical protein BWK76_07050 [Desulfobulbaceae bacterium A2]